MDQQQREKLLARGERLVAVIGGLSDYDFSVRDFPDGTGGVLLSPAAVERAIAKIEDGGARAERELASARAELRDLREELRHAGIERDLLA